MKEITKVAKKKRCQSILKKGILSKEDQQFLKELIKSHPNYSFKVGKGISNFFIKKTEWGCNGFWIKRVDGSETDASYKQCLLPRTHLQNVKIACRSAIAQDIFNSKHHGGIAHHEGLSFIEIFLMWIDGKDINAMEIKNSKDNCVVVTFKDEQLSNSFRVFHNKFATIKEVSYEEHKKIHSKK